MTIKTRLSRLEQAMPGKGNLLICHRHGPQDEEHIAALRAQAQRSGSHLVVINGWSRYHWIAGYEH